MAKPLVLGNSNVVIPCSYDVLVNIIVWYCFMLWVGMVWLFSCVDKGEPLQFSPKRAHLS